MAFIYNVFTEKELISLLQQDNEAAFNEIYNRYWQKLYNHCYNRLKDQHLCADVIQDVFVDLWAKRSVRNIDNLGAYLYTSALYQVFMLHKKHRNIISMEEFIETVIPSPVNTDTVYLEKEIRGCVSNWLEVQPARRKEVFRLKFFEDRDSREISEMLNVSQKTVQNQFTTSINALRIHLSKLLTILL